ncbi:hypothetical protein HEK616_27840 [Streptomyces nigrescens]|uniref:Uncharacterized protein n=1 Tax=Streptomyces nigrescens TaxID=1920 RepID=A0ABM7ZSF0_STRNI|nr:hypothetical protein HEK616_27840 [Streptomyces nigrescens]
MKAGLRYRRVPFPVFTGVRTMTMTAFREKRNAGRWGQAAKPPSMVRLVPVMKADSGPAR